MGIPRTRGVQGQHPKTGREWAEGRRGAKEIAPCPRAGSEGCGGRGEVGEVWGAEETPSPTPAAGAVQREVRVVLWGLLDERVTVVRHRH